MKKHELLLFESGHVFWDDPKRKARDSNWNKGSKILEFCWEYFYRKRMRRGGENGEKKFKFYQTYESWFHA
jgi:hypothetical protein